MYILGLDTTMNACSAALVRASDLSTVKRSIPMARGHAEHLVPLILEVMSEAEIAFDDISLIAVTKGPGAFTGMRIGLATAKALSLTLGVSATGVCTFEAVRMTYYDIMNSDFRAEACAVILETKRADFYVQVFDAKGVALSSKLSAPSPDILDFIPEGALILGDASSRFQRDLQDYGLSRPDLKYQEILFPDPSVIAKIGLYQNQGDVQKKEYNLSPVYIRPPDVSLPGSHNGSC